MSLSENSDFIYFSDTFTAEKPSRFMSQLSSEDDGLDKEAIDKISLTLHHPLDKNSEEENLAAGLADIDSNRTFIFGQSEDGNLMDLEQTLDDQPPSIHASAVGLIVICVSMRKLHILQKNA